MKEKHSAQTLPELTYGDACYLNCSLYIVQNYTGGSSSDKILTAHCYVSLLIVPATFSFCQILLLKGENAEVGKALKRRE